ncbi:MAG: hypothetical protein ACI9G6_002842, partial [Limisphaerales bacterium]
MTITTKTNLLEQFSLFDALTPSEKNRLSEAMEFRNKARYS